jgi:hypothetical protein
VIERIATLQEIEIFWSLDDVMDANEALDAWQEAEALANQRASKRGG